MNFHYKNEKRLLTEYKMYRIFEYNLRIPTQFEEWFTNQIEPRGDQSS